MSDTMPAPTPTTTTDPLTIYVAGSSAEREEIAAFIKVLGEYGYTVTHDWTDESIWYRPAEAYTDEFLTECAKTDLDAVRRAAVVWYLVPHEGKSEGAAVELGADLALGKETVVSGHGDPPRIFLRLAESRYHLHAAALEYLRMRAKVWL